MQGEIGPGYKQTDVGAIPEDWMVGPLREALVSNPSYGINAAAVPYSSDLPRYIRITDITDSGGFSQEKPVCVDSPFSTNYLVAHGDILLARTGASVGKSYLHRSFSEPLVYAGFLILARPRSDKNDPAYIYANLNTPRYWDWIKTESQRSGQPGINGKQYASFSLALPPLSEQRAIAAALTDADALIAALEGVIAKKRDLKQAAMQHLLTGKTRLPGFSGDWEVKRLGEIGRALIGLTYRPSDIRSFGTLVLRSSNIQNGILDFDDNVYVDPEVAQKSIIEVGDLLICARNGSRDLIGKSVRIDERAQGMAFGAFMAAYRSEFNDFISFQFQSDLIKRQINEHLGATINQITNKSLLSFQVPLPNDRVEQAAIAEVLSDMVADLAALEAQAAKARAIKQGMMQELLTGRVRLV